MRGVYPMILALTSAAALPGVQAEEAGTAQELHELRQAVQQQSKQLELLAEQVGKLTRVLETHKGGEAAAKPSEPEPAPAASATTSVESPKPAAETTSAAAEPAKPEAIPKADAVPGT